VIRPGRLPVSNPIDSVMTLSVYASWSSTFDQGSSRHLVSVRLTGSASARSAVRELIEALAAFNNDVELTFQTSQFVCTRIGDHCYRERRRATIHAARVL
jgi:hypothetical protein